MELGCAYFRYSRKSAPGELVGGEYIWFSETRQWAISEFIDKMVEMLKIHDKPKDRDAGDLIYKKLSRPR